MVARIVKDSYPGHTLSRPADWRQPFIFCCPHSGRDYPRKLLGLSPLPLETLRRSEDAYVDQLIPQMAQDLVPVLGASFPRLFVDVNRSPRELDPLLFSGPLDDASESRSNRVVAGFGVIPKLAADGRQIYPSRLPSSEAKSRLKHCYRPYHKALGGLIEEARRRFPSVLVVDWHSMPSSAGSSGRLPDIVLGDLHGASCTEEQASLWEDAFRAEDFTVTRNAPYAGGYVAAHYGRPADRVGVLQIEINRSLYMDERRVARGRDFAAFAARIENVIDRVLMLNAPAAVAAE
ncbi:N-formylglutamate amidohydrolase [Parvularcula lutaonensis]|uniref:N-formylglutamate amidohydrolase n=1 Tax=Parvularcula lutaonensis TaxID=491923 RepID=A0ABV7MDC0_9PROT|nr:N-formylglutamate amidohydrolase [Parvularcula lutaonensis]GGY48990.1 N-formylglutamate amidohydrolase [Parvularcula lutaonensis]